MNGSVDVRELGALKGSGGLGQIRGDPDEFGRRPDVGGSHTGQHDR
ncbi:hypothetical protein [Corynebacterium kroppenstedtii]|nr:hypothetical protein [Corynebacterium kroppenstedtii]MDU7286847.1 hypothetical protein [Corynebacterium kroppenstedtii]